MSATLPDEFSIQDEFPPVDYDQWRALVEQSLAGAPFEKKLVTHTYEGLDIQPVYTRRDELPGEDPMGFPGLEHCVRGATPLGSVRNGWDLRQEFSDPRLAESNQAILNDLRGGVTSLQLRLDRSAQSGKDAGPTANQFDMRQAGLLVYSVDDLDQLLAGVHLDMVPIALEAGAAFMPAASMLLGLWQRRQIDPQQAQAALNADPLGTLARDGSLPIPLDMAISLMADLSKHIDGGYPQVRAVGVDTAVYHDAGATAAQDIAFAAATGLEYMRALQKAGFTPARAASQMLFHLSLGTHHFMAIAKLRAMRWVWTRIVEACGSPPSSNAIRIHARTSRRVLTQHDPYVNLLRNSVAVFAAGIGGADAITSVPFDDAVGLPDAFSRRVARNSVLVLQDEAQLHRVLDPAGGSWFLDRLTDQLAHAAWKLLQEIEAGGGMRSALCSNWVAEQLDQAHAARAKDIALRKQGITGISEFPNVLEERVLPDTPDMAAHRAAAANRLGQRGPMPLPQLAAAENKTMACQQAAVAGATLGELAQGLGFGQSASDSIRAIPPRSLSAPFEHLRDACEAWLAARGQRPRVFLVTLGPVAHYSGRAAWSKNFFEVGGFEVLGGESFADVDQAADGFGRSEAPIAVICSSDKLYPDLVPAAAAKLRAAGARSIVLAGHPGANEQAWRDAGVDRFIFIKCDVFETLHELLTELGVLPLGGQTR